MTTTYGTLIDYATGEHIGPATREGGDLRTVYVEGGPATYYLAYETPGGSDSDESAWVTRSEADGQVSNPIHVTGDIDADDADAAQMWATDQLAALGVAVQSWSRLPGMDWDTYRAEVRRPRQPSGCVTTSWSAEPVVRYGNAAAVAAGRPWSSRTK